MTETRRFAADEMMSVPMQVVAVNEILKGTFNDEIAKLTVLKDEIAKRQAVDKRFTDADAQFAKLQTDIAQAKKELDDLQAAKKVIADAALKLDAERATLGTSQANLARAVAKLDTDRAGFEAYKANNEALMSQRAQALDLRESEVSAAEASLKEGQDKLAAEREAFNKRLDALKV